MKITIDVTPIDAKPSGVGLYVSNLVHALSELQQQESFELALAYQPGLKNWLKGNWQFPEKKNYNAAIYEVPIPVRISNLCIDYLPQFFPFYLEPKLGETNIFHGTNYTVYPMKNIGKIISIYDLSFIRYPQYVNSVVEAYTDRLKKCLAWTDAIVTISESSKQDIVQYLNFDPEKVFVTYLASRYDHQSIKNLNVEQLISHVNIDFSQPYLLFVSTLEPRKNIVAIIEAFNQLKSRYKIDHQLILIGRKGWKYEPIFTAIENSPWRHEIHHLDYVSDELVEVFYANADVFVYPSHYEGFGLPVLEAMTLGAPVVSSNTSSIPEVAGDAALLVDPNDTEQIAEAIFSIVGDRQLRQTLIDRGKLRASLFSWENTARQTLKAYRSIL